MATHSGRTTSDRAVRLHLAGTRCKGEYRCANCGYGVAIHDELPVCPMCHEKHWEAVPWRPFTRAEPPFLDAFARGDAQPGEDVDSV